MSREPLMPEVLDGLTAAIQRSRPRRRRFLPHGLGLGLAVVLVSGTAVAAVMPQVPWNPFGGAADAPVSTTPPPPDQLATLAVLRRPQTGRDRTALITAYLKRTGKRPGAKIRVDYVRALGDVEVGGIGFVGGRQQARTRLGQLVLTPQERDTTDQSQIAHQLGRFEFCLDVVYDFWPDPAVEPAPQVWPPDPDAPAPTRPPDLVDRVLGGGTCGDAHVVRMKGLSIGGAMFGRVTGIVPDGVAAVQAQTRDGQLVTAKVVDNAYQLLAPGRNLPQDGSDTGRGADMRPPKSGQFKSGTFRWLDASGAVTRRLPY